jgi:hypothetical protein
MYYPNFSLNRFSIIKDEDKDTGLSGKAMHVNLESRLMHYERPLV